MSILIVEDNPVNARLLQLMLTAQGYQTVVARNGNEALAAVPEIPDLQLIITDYMMPEMDGFEFIAKVKALPTFHHVPILVASAHTDLETVKRAQSVQCDGFLAKPINKTQLIKRVKHLLHVQLSVLLDKQIMMDRLDCGLKDYNLLINDFEAQVATTMPIVVLEQGDSDEPISENLKRLLEELAESAATLGADKFVRLYSACIGGGQLTRSHCSELRKGIQELEMALRANTQSQPSAVKETDAA
jgi:CheY-like chemotaxis protein